MPTILRLGPFRFFFYMGDWREPPHIHVEAGDKLAKFWLEPVRLASSDRFRAHELARVRAIVAEHESTFREAWRVRFGR